MNEVVKKEWVAALRSGEYKQGSGELKTTEGAFCCLGVLCDLYSKEKGVLWGGEMLWTHIEFPPPAVVAWAGLLEDSPEVEIAEGDKRSLPHVNDELEYSFEQIADLIEEQL